MAKKPATLEPEVVDIYETGDDLSLALDQLYADADTRPTRALAHVYMVEPEADVKIWKGEIEDYDLDSLAKKFGSANYRLKVYVMTEKGNFGLKINKVFAYRISPEEDARLRAIRKGEVLPQSAQAPSLTAEGIAAAVASALKAVLPAQVAAPINNLGMLKEVAEIVRTLAPQPQSIQPQFNPMDMLKLAFDATRRDSDDDVEPIRRGVNANSADIFMRLIDKFAPLFQQTLMNGSTVAALPNPADASQSSPVAAAPVQATVSPAQPGENEAMMKLRMGLQFLVMQAQADNDPATYADVVLDNVPPEDLKAFLASADPLAYLVKTNPDVQKYAQWFRDLIETVKDDLTENAEPAIAPVDPSAKTV